MKKALLIALLFVATAPFGASAQGYCDTSGNSFMRFLWPCGTGPGAMREVMTVHSWGPESSPSYHGGSGGSYQVSYPQMPQLGTQYQYPQYSYPQQYQPMPQPTYYQPQYSYPQYQQPQYSYPQYQYSSPQYGYQQPYQQYYQPYPQNGLYQAAIYPPSPTQMSGISPQPVGGHDIWGDPLCNWGSGYYGYSCYQDPHQWIFDSYTGQWY